MRNVHLARAAARTALAGLAIAAAAPIAAPLGAQTLFFGADARDAFAAAATAPATNAIGTAGPTYEFGSLGTGTVTGNGIATNNGYIFGTGGGLPTPAYTITFSQALGAFGADFTGLGTMNTDFPYPAGVAEFTFFSGASTVGTFTQSFGSTGALVFLGFTDLPAFDRVEVRTNVGDEFFTDDVIVGAPSVSTPPPSVVPEPSTVVLVGAVLAGLAGVARRRPVVAAD